MRWIARRRGARHRWAAMSRNESDRGFLATWWKCSLGVYVLWCQLAGVGFLLALAFLGDAGGGTAHYLRDVGSVGFFLFVVPIPVAMAAGALPASLHTGVTRLLRRRGPVSPAPPPVAAAGGARIADAAATSQPPADAPPRNAPAVGRRAGSWARSGLRLLAYVSIAAGFFIVATNAPREAAQKGVGQAIAVSLLFVGPLVVLPLAWLITGRSRQHGGAGDAAGPVGAPPKTRA
ncbi:MAG: hypothetical protein INH34_18025 [Phycisphaerales bacterium]|nr:hypothetical protein [Phycisphaerales bacterium]